MAGALYGFLRRSSCIVAFLCAVIGPQEAEAFEPEEPPQAIYAPQDYRIDGDIREWKSSDPTIRVDGAMDVWIAQTDAGIVVAGTGPAVNSVDGINVWLADEKQAVLPSIGWRMRFGEVFLPSEEFCAVELQSPGLWSEPGSLPSDECRAWFRRHAEYRMVVRKLFERRWRLQRGQIEEMLAAPAYASLYAYEREGLKALDPATGIQSRPEGSVGRPFIGGPVYFELEIPWAALPPSSSLEFRALRIAISTGSTRAESLDTGERLRWSGLVRLAEPREFFIAPCRYSLPELQFATDRIVPENWSSSGGGSSTQLQRWISASYYVRHALSLDVREVIALHNAAVGVGVMGPGAIYDGVPARRSPRASVKKHFVLQTPGETTLCGPDLAAVAPSEQEAVNAQTYEIGYFMGDYWGGVGPDAELERVGDYLLVRHRTDPYIYPMCGGSCGCCPTVRYEVFKVSFDPLRIDQVFDFNRRWGNGNYFDVYMEDDWSKIYTIESRWGEPWSIECQNMRWKKITYCLDAETGAYTVCDSKDGSPMPATIHIDLPMECNGSPKYVGSGTATS